ncbi:MAG TPA: serine--tRNA ligase, partial [Alphaproteobacteria bacterium]|nr:serine--tRNA ligase [Alphaproteobacteria bacterium]
MFDIKWIRDNPAEFDGALERRGLKPQAERVLEFDRMRREAQAAAQAIQEERNALSKQIGIAKSKGEDAAPIMARVATLKDKLAEAEARVRAAEHDQDAFLAGLPNLPADDVPDGADETANVELRRIGAPPKFAFKPKEHDDIGQALGLMDFERAAKLSGARFVVLMGKLARLERALAQFMLDLHTKEFGYTEVSPPALVRDAAVFGTGQLPKFSEDLFATRALNEERFRIAVNERVTELIEQATKTINESNRDLGLPPWTTKELLLANPHIIKNVEEDFLRILKRDEYFDKYWLIPTAEVPLTNLVAGEILDEKALPLRFTALTPCFRAEAGAAGKDTKGMLRQHQFQKVELVSIAHPEKSEEEHARMTACAEEVLKRLGLPYRVVALSTGDMGFAARKTYDIEVWLPGQNRYREISSCSNCGDFQARRMNARYRPGGEKGTRFVHTLNGSGLAVG